MIVYLTLTVFVLVLSGSVRIQEQTAYGADCTKQYLYNRIALFFIFLALFLVSAMRINVGNDYGTYVEFMHRVASGFTHYVPTEPGFNFLAWATHALYGGRYYLIVFAVFAAGTVLCFLKGIWDMSDDFALSFALFMLLGYYFQSISTVRYYLALGMAFYGIRYVLRADYVRFVLLVIAGALFHRSMLVVLVLYPLAKLQWRKWMYAVFAAACISCLFLQEAYLAILLRLYPSYEDTAYLEGGTSLINIARCAFMLLAAIILYRKRLLECERARDGAQAVLRFYCHANLMALALYTFGSFLPIVSRIAYYLSVTQILMIPFLIERIGESGIGDAKRLKRIARIAVLVVSLGYFAIYMRRAGNDGVRILPYQSFLFHEMPPILSERGIH